MPCLTRSRARAIERRRVANEIMEERRRRIRRNLQRAARRSRLDRFHEFERGFYARARRRETLSLEQRRHEDALDNVL